MRLSFYQGMLTVALILVDHHVYSISAPVDDWANLAETGSQLQSTGENELMTNS